MISSVKYDFQVSSCFSLYVLGLLPFNSNLFIKPILVYSLHLSSKNSSNNYLCLTSIAMPIRWSISGNCWGSFFALLSNKLSASSKYTKLGSCQIVASDSSVESLVLITLTNLFFSSDPGLHSIKCFQKRHFMSFCDLCQIA